MSRNVSRTAPGKLSFFAGSTSFVLLRFDAHPWTCVSEPQNVIFLSLGKRQERAVKKVPKRESDVVVIADELVSVEKLGRTHQSQNKRRE